MVADLDNGFVLPQVPDNRFATWADRGQDVLDLPVPGDGADVFSGLKEQKMVIATGLAVGVNTSQLYLYFQMLIPHL